jgi:hypothetical protein
MEIFLNLEILGEKKIVYVTGLKFPFCKRKE